MHSKNRASDRVPLLDVLSASVKKEQQCGSVELAYSLVQLFIRSSVADEQSVVLEAAFSVGDEAGPLTEPRLSLPTTHF